MLERFLVRFSILLVILIASVMIWKEKLKTLDSQVSPLPFHSCLGAACSAQPEHRGPHQMGEKKYFERGLE